MIVIPPCLFLQGLKVNDIAYIEALDTDLYRDYGFAPSHLAYVIKWLHDNNMSLKAIFLNEYDRQLGEPGMLSLSAPHKV